MIAAIEAGNSTIAVALFDGPELVARWSLASSRERSAEDFGQAIGGFLAVSGISVDELESCVIASVVPPLTDRLVGAFRLLNSREVLVVTNRWDLGIRNLCQPPEEVGIDRLLNTAAAYDQFQESCIVIDLGTATTFDVVTSDGEFIGGAIAPGLRIAADALAVAAPRLGEIDLVSPDAAIGANTRDAIRSGVVLGYASMVDGMAERIRGEINGPARVIATGGLAATMAGVSSAIELVNPNLTLQGVRLAYERFRRDGRTAN